ncbi:MAG: hypothetical protein KDC79_16605 [Cyclobacteriaceae bacterium]|nr:hypothetical protein [Cyclobacteriaceae bacterium]
MQKKKNIQLLFALAMVIALIALLPLLKKKGSGLEVDRHLFTLGAQTVITDVILKTDSATNKLCYVNGKWRVNDKYDLDLSMRDVFFSVLSQLEIKRPVAESQSDSIAEIIRNKGVEVTILNNADTVKSYSIWGDKDSESSFIMGAKSQPYLIHIPGYRSYVAGIFEVPESDWRTRRVFSTTYTNLNELKLEYSDGNSLTYRYKNSFFEIEGVHADSTQLINSLENLLFLQTDQYLLPSEMHNYVDANFNSNPFVTIAAIKLSGSMEKTRLYDPRPDKPYYLGITPDSSFCLFNKKRMKRILVKKKDFE